MVGAVRRGWSLLGAVGGGGRPIRWGTTSLAYEDGLLLRLRVERLKEGPFSQNPRSRCQHVLQQPEPEGMQDGLYVVRTAFVYVEVRGDEQQVHAGTAIHHLRDGEDGLRIVLKRVKPVVVGDGDAVVAVVSVSGGMPTALLTGGSAGIGRAIAEALLVAGHEVVSLDQAAPTIEHDNLHTLTVDLLSAAETHDAALEAAEKWRPTILVHNAGAIRPALLPDVNRVDLDALVSLHLGAAITMVQATLPAMREDGWGRVVLISSRAALGLATRTSLSATKAGMIGMARDVGAGAGARSG